VFADVHSKSRLKERIAAANKDDRELRESKAGEKPKIPRLRRQLVCITCISAHHLLGNRKRKILHQSWPAQ
jgi:hypothetical protein